MRFSPLAASLLLCWPVLRTASSTGLFAASPAATRTSLLRPFCVAWPDTWRSGTPFFPSAAPARLSPMTPSS